MYNVFLFSVFNKVIRLKHCVLVYFAQSNRLWAQIHTCNIITVIVSEAEVESARKLQSAVHV